MSGGVKVLSASYNKSQGYNRGKQQPQTQVSNSQQVKQQSKPSSTGVRRKNTLPDQGGPANGTLTNKPGTTTKKYNKDGKTVKEYNTGHPDHDPNSLNAKDHVHDYRKPGDGSKKSRMPARTPKRNEAKKDFNR